LTHATVSTVSTRPAESQPTDAERRQRTIDQASLAQRIRWTATGVPIEERDSDTGE